MPSGNISSLRFYFWNNGTDLTENMTGSADYDVEPSPYNGKIAWTSESDIDGVKEIYFLARTAPPLLYR